MLNLSVVPNSPVWGSQTVWTGGEVNSEPLQSYDSPTQTESISEPEAARCYWIAAHTGLGSMAKLELTIDRNHPLVYLPVPSSHFSRDKQGKRAKTSLAEVKRQHVAFTPWSEKKKDSEKTHSSSNDLWGLNGALDSHFKDHSDPHRGLTCHLESGRYWSCPAVMGLKKEVSIFPKKF